MRIFRLLEVPSFILDWSSFYFKYSLIHACSLIKHFVKRNTLQREGGVKFPQKGLLTEGGWRWIPAKRTTDRGRLVLNAHKTDLWNIKGAWCQWNKFPQNGYWQKEGSFDFLKTEHRQREVGVKISQKEKVTTGRGWSKIPPKRVTDRGRVAWNSYKSEHWQREGGVKFPQNGALTEGGWKQNQWWDLSAKCYLWAEVEVCQVIKLKLERGANKIFLHWTHWSYFISRLYWNVCHCLLLK